MTTNGRRAAAPKSVDDDRVELPELLLAQQQALLTLTGEVREQSKRCELLLEQGSRLHEAVREALLDTVARQERQLTSLLVRQRDLAEAIDGLKDRLVSHAQETASSLYTFQATQSGSRELVAPTPQKLAYQQMIGRVRKLVNDRLPADAVVIAVSRGDDELLKLYGRRGWHFPREASGVYAGYHPHSGSSAVVHLEALRAFGGEYFLLPATSMWWFDRYPELHRHLEENYRKLADEPEVAVIFALNERAAEAGSRTARALRDLVRECSDFFGEDSPVVLDWATGLNVSGILPGIAVFGVPNAAGEHLPYIDDSVSIVALRSADPVAMAEAERVAQIAVINVDPEVNGQAERVYDGTSQARVSWLRPKQPSDVVASIVIPCFNELRYTKICLAALRENMPVGQAVEVVVVDDGSTDGSREWLSEQASTTDWLRVVRNEVNSGFVDAVNLGADAATAELLVLLNNDCIPLPGWLKALQRTFREHDDAGAVGGRLLFPDGRLQEAGGVVFKDGTAAKIGYRELDIDAPLFNFVRRVDYCSAALLATPRALFREIGGLDARYSPAYYEDTDYCFKVRERGLEVYYQPECAVIHVEGVTAGSEVTHGAKRHQLVNHQHFTERWRDVLLRHPERPSEPFGPATLHRLVRGEREVCGE